jgi:DNA-binding response OmpR family regulator
VRRVLFVGGRDLVGRRTLGRLRSAGLEPVVVASGRLGLEHLGHEQLDVCVLDLRLADLDGLTLIELVRGRGVQTPIIAVAGAHDESRLIRALELGADDYVAHPFSDESLIARIRATSLRSARQRVNDLADETIEIGGLRIEPRQFQAYLDGRSAGLTPTEFRVLHMLAASRGRVLSREELLRRIWGREQAPRDRTVDVCIKRLRDKIDRRSHDRTFIQTRFGIGYMLEPLEREPARAG